MKKEYKYHYVYRITNIVTGYHYYGSKSCNEEPQENIGKKYLSNSTNKLFIKDQKNNPQDYKYKVIKIFETKRDDAIEFEALLHRKFDVKYHPKFINKANQTSKKFDTTGFINVIDIRDNKKKYVSISEFETNKNYKSFLDGKVIVLDKRDNSKKQISIEEFKKHSYYESIFKDTIVVLDLRTNNFTRVDKVDFEKYDYYVSSNKGKTTVLDLDSQEYKYVSVDELKNNDKYISIHKNKVTVLDLRTGETKRVSTEDYKKYEYYESLMKNVLTVLDIRDNKLKRVSIEDYKKFDYYKSKDSKHYEIYSAEGELVYSIYGSFKNFCSKNELPYDAFMNSYKNNAKPLYCSNKATSVKPKFKKFKGWYAVLID